MKEHARFLNWQKEQEKLAMLEAEKIKIQLDKLSDNHDWTPQQRVEALSSIMSYCEGLMAELEPTGEE